MYSYYILGKTYKLKELIKKIKPHRKDFKGWWHFNYDLNAWELNVPNHCNCKKFKTQLQAFCDENSVKLEVLEFTKSLVKSMKDFKTIEGFFSYFHKQNSFNNSYK